MSKKLFKNTSRKLVTVGNTCLTIKPYKLGDVPALEHRLSVYDKLYRKYRPIAMDIIDNTLYIPDTVDINKIAKVYNGEDNIMVEKLDADKKQRVDFNMLVAPRDEAQIRALDFLIGRDKYISNMYYPKLLLSLDTGGGKTFCTLSAISYLGFKSAIILPDNALVERWTDEIYKITDMTEDDIYVIKGINSIIGVGKKAKNKKIILISHRTITSFGKTHGWRMVEKLFKVMKIGIKVYDEAHKEFKNIMKIDLHSNIYKTIYLTATAARSSVTEDMLYKTLFNNVPSLVTTTSERSENHINMVIYQYDSNPSSLDKIKCKKPQGFSAVEYMKYNLDKGKISFLKSIEFFMNTVLSHSPDGKILIMVGLIDMIQLLEGHLRVTYPKYANDIGIYCSKISPKARKYNLDNKRIIITTFKSLGTGVDIDGLKYICMAEPYSSEIIAKQCSGRLRQSGWYFEIVNMGFDDCKRQYAHREKILVRKANKYKIVKNI